MSNSQSKASLSAIAAAVLSSVVIACSAPAQPQPQRRVTPVYSKETGRLEQLTSDRNGDGKIDTRAFMDGTRLQRVEIDRNGDSKPDRWEHYKTSPDARATSQVEIERAEEASASDERITRREFFEGGAVIRVEEDTDADGRTDKWEHYRNGQLVRIELDLKGAGFPDRRMTYRRDGNVDRVEEDPDGRGNWRPFTPPAS